MKVRSKCIASEREALYIQITVILSHKTTKILGGNGQKVLSLGKIYQTLITIRGGCNADDSFCRW